MDYWPAYRHPAQEKPNALITNDEYDLLEQLVHGEIKAEDWLDELESILKSLSTIKGE